VRCRAGRRLDAAHEQRKRNRPILGRRKLDGLALRKAPVCRSRTVPDTLRGTGHLSIVSALSKNFAVSPGTLGKTAIEPRETAAKCPGGRWRRDRGVYAGLSVPAKEMAEDADRRIGKTVRGNDYKRRPVTREEGTPPERKKTAISHGRVVAMTGSRSLSDDIAAWRRRASGGGRAVFGGWPFGSFLPPPTMHRPPTQERCGKHHAKAGQHIQREAPPIPA